MSSFLKRIMRRLTDQYSSTEFNEYQDYVEIQRRCDPKEFVDHRVNAVSGLAFALDELKKRKISKPVFVEDGKAKGQLVEDQIAILDAGTRDGWVVEFLQSLGYPNTKGVELLGEYVKYAKEKGRDVCQGDLHQLPFDDEHFDFVFSRHTLEHCLKPVDVLNEMLRVLKTGGALYCSFPLVAEPHGKHTLAIRNIKTIHKILKSLKCSYQPIYIGKTSSTRVIPEGDEVIIFITKDKNN